MATEHKFGKLKPPGRDKNEHYYFEKFLFVVGLTTLIVTAFKIYYY